MTTETIQSEKTQESYEFAGTTVKIIYALMAVVAFFSPAIEPITVAMIAAAGIAILIGFGISKAEKIVATIGIAVVTTYSVFTQSMAPTEYIPVFILLLLLAYSVVVDDDGLLFGLASISVFTSLISSFLTVGFLFIAIASLALYPLSEKSRSKQVQIGLVFFISVVGALVIYALTNDTGGDLIILPGEDYWAPVESQEL